MKITFLSKRFIVNEVKRTVVCVLEYTVDGYHFPHPVIGKAKANPEDEFSEYVGKKIALARAESQAYINESEIVKKRILKLKESIYDYRIFIDKAYGVVAHNKQYINSL